MNQLTMMHHADVVLNILTFWLGLQKLIEKKYRYPTSVRNVWQLMYMNFNLESI